MSKDYQAEVLDFLRPTSVKLGLAEAKSAYGKEINIGAKAVKELSNFGKSVQKLRKEVGKKDGPKGIGGVYDKIMVIDGMVEDLNNQLRDAMDIFASLEDYREKK